MVGQIRHLRSAEPVSRLLEHVLILADVDG